MIYLTIDKVPSTPYFEILDVRRPILPPIEDVTEQIGGRHGLIDFGQKIGARIIEVDIMLHSTSIEEFRKQVDRVASFIFSSEVRELQFSDEPNIIYYARLTGETNLEQLVSWGTTTLTFVCFDPYKYDAEETIYSKTEVCNNDLIPIENLSDSTLFPEITITNVGQPIENLCPNPDFEENTDGWIYQDTGNSSGALTRDTSMFYNGVASARLSKLNADDSIPRCYFILTDYEVGVEYTFEAYVRSEVADGLRVYAEEENQETWEYTQISEVVYSDIPDQWRRVTFTFTPQVEGEAGTVFIFFEAFQSGVYSSWIDAVNLFKENVNIIRQPELVFQNYSLRHKGNLLINNSLVINLEKRTVRLNGTIAMNNIEGKFFSIPKGNHNITFKANEGVAKITVKYRNRWL